MKKLTVKYHSMIDVITNSSTEIFSMATMSGMKRIESLVKTIISTFGSDVEYSDVIKGIYISPSDVDKELSLYCMYLKEHPSDIIPPELSVIISEFESFSDIEKEFYGDTGRLIKSLINGIEGVENRYFDEDYIKFIQREIENYNDRHYDYPMETDYYIVANDAKYKELVSNISNILNCYEQSAVYC